MCQPILPHHEAERGEKGRERMEISCQHVFVSEKQGE